ncbi:MAG: TIGR03086 family metal-binding protein [Acidimicrobiales bacterium]
MDSVALLQRVVNETTGVIDNIRPDQLGEPTPCTEWTIRDLVNHITGGSTVFAVSAEQGSVPDDLLAQLMGGDNLGDDYAGAWKTASTRAMAVFAQPGVLDKIVKLPFGEMPAGIALNIAIFDVATHAADLARATGQTIADTDLLEAALTIGREMIGPDLRQPGVFDAEQAAGPDAPAADRLLAFAGRKL